LGENITTRGIDLPSLGRGTQLQLGADAVIEITGLRNPCRQIDENVAPGAMAAMIERRSDRSPRRKAGVMAVVLASGEVREGDPVTVAFVPPDAPALEPV
jgi:MOSC domain-containing protein YiiM